MSNLIKSQEKAHRKNLALGLGYIQVGDDRFIKPPKFSIGTYIGKCRNFNGYVDCYIDGIFVRKRNTPHVVYGISNPEFVGKLFTESEIEELMEKLKTDFNEYLKGLH